MLAKQPQIMLKSSRAHFISVQNIRRVSVGS